MDVNSVASEFGRWRPGTNELVTELNNLESYTVVLRPILTRTFKKTEGEIDATVASYMDHFYSAGAMDDATVRLLDGVAPVLHQAFAQEGYDLDQEEAFARLIRTSPVMGAFVLTFEQFQIAERRGSGQADNEQSGSRSS